MNTVNNRKKFQFCIGDGVIILIVDLLFKESSLDASPREHTSLPARLNNDVGYIVIRYSLCVSFGLMFLVVCSIHKLKLIISINDYGLMVSVIISLAEK